MGRTACTGSVSLSPLWVRARSRAHAGVDWQSQQNISVFFPVIPLSMTIPRIDWLIVWCLTPFSTVFQLYRCGQCSYPCFPGVLLTSTQHNIPSKPLAAFPHNHYRNIGQRWQRNESCRNDYHQSLEGILAEHEDRISDLLFSSHARYQLNYWSWLHHFKTVRHDKSYKQEGQDSPASSPHLLMPCFW